MSRILIDIKHETPVVMFMGADVKTNDGRITGKVSGGMLPTKKLGAGLVRVSHPNNDNLKWDYYLPAALGLCWVTIDEWAKLAKLDPNGEEAAAIEHELGMCPYKLKAPI